MLSNKNTRASTRPVAVVSFIAFTTLAACVKAGDPELFRANPYFLEDQTVNFPTSGSSGIFNYEIIQGIAVFEGDILLGKVDQNGTLPQKITERGLGRNDPFGRWPDGVVPYFVPTNSTNTQRRRIVEALEHWTEKTSLSFVERNTENQELYPNFVRFESSNSCASYVGMQGGEQPILISDACSVGSVVHEIGHALGLFHEHTRPDRDNFAQINWGHIVPGKEINFETLEGGVQNYGPYDYGSIMHYGEYFFSSNGEPTIVVPDGISIGQRQSLSDLDIAAVNNMYATDLALFEPTITAVEAGLEVGISIANQGELGAQQVQLIANVTDSAEWQGISPDSGWECETVGTELQCARPTLAEQTTSNFTLLMNSSSSDTVDLSLVLTSRTTDIDLSNNSFNDDTPEAQASEPSAPIVTQASIPTPQAPQTAQIPETLAPATPVTAVPAIGTAQTAQPNPIETTTAPPKLGAAQAAGGGSDNGFLAALAGLAIVWQRARKMKIKESIAKRLRRVN